MCVVTDKCITVTFWRYISVLLLSFTILTPHHCRFLPVPDLPPCPAPTGPERPSCQLFPAGGGGTQTEAYFPPFLQHPERPRPNPGHGRGKWGVLILLDYLLFNTKGMNCTLGIKVSVLFLYSFVRMMWTSKIVLLHLTDNLSVFYICGVYVWICQYTHCQTIVS